MPPEFPSKTKAASCRSLPSWIRVRVPADAASGTVANILERQNVRTVCRGAACPNILKCFSRGTATFMILGGVCTRSCRFCAVPDGVPQPLDPGEPERVAAAAQAMNLKHVVVTSVTRDDLRDGGAGHFVAVIKAVKRVLPAATTEILVPDFHGRLNDVDTVLAAGPDVFNHNIETVPRLQKKIRPQASYRRSLRVLQRAAAAVTPRGLVKSGLMVGLGESEDEIRQTLQDLRAAGCELLTIGQYLAPSADHWPVHRFVPPQMFAEYAQWARAMGFRESASGPLVRSSFQAGAMLRNAQSGREQCAHAVHQPCPG